MSSITLPQPVAWSGFQFLETRPEIIRNLHNAKMPVNKVSKDTVDEEDTVGEKEKSCDASMEEINEAGNETYLLLEKQQHPLDKEFQQQGANNINMSLPAKTNFPELVTEIENQNVAQEDMIVDGAGDQDHSNENHKSEKKNNNVDGE